MWKLALSSFFALILSACGEPQASKGGAVSQGPDQAPTQAVYPAKIKQTTEYASAADLPDPKAGAFDFYVLALSWSPTYCLDAGEGADPTQCSRSRPFDFVVHGLWPETERGRMEECEPGEGDRPRAKLMDSMLDIMPSPGLVRHEWKAHGQCSGLSPEEYFAAVRKARSLVEIPREFVRPKDEIVTTPSAVEEAFLTENKGLKPAGVAVTCSGRRLKEVRICLTKSFAFRTCSDVDRRSCKRQEITAPTSRGG